MKRIFISYSRRDKQFATRLAQSLTNNGADVWIDMEDIPAGVKWSTAIQQGLKTCDIMLVIVSPDAMQSTNVEDEWQYYLDRGKPILPILWRPADMHFQLNRIQYIDFHSQSYETALRQLVDEMQRQGIDIEETVQAVPPVVQAPRPVATPPTVSSQPPLARPRSNRGLSIAIGAGVVIIIAAVVVVVLLNVLPSQQQNAQNTEVALLNAGLTQTAAERQLELEASQTAIAYRDQIAATAEAIKLTETAAAAIPSPDQAVLDYYALINQHAYYTSYALLTERFRTERSPSQAEYESFWLTVTTVVVESPAILSQTSDRASVQCTLTFNMNTGSSLRYTQQLEMIYDSTTGHWLIDATVTTRI
ncbi:MAG: toll/interleukin-1 receptor domain-containing protein [Anaerolineae bacterium]|nr:toll/interleukin-1 receptor domain-containing protein [Anaerolineae bacterium]